MSTYICYKCGCIDNSACGGNYWSVRSKQNCYKEEYANTHELCVECTPKEYDDGSVNEEHGEWHNKFPKRHWSEYGSKEKVIEECKKNNGNLVNAIEYFKENNLL